jgi:hypothetical protein
MERFESFRFNNVELIGIKGILKKKKSKFDQSVRGSLIGDAEHLYCFMDGSKPKKRCWNNRFFAILCLQRYFLRLRHLWIEANCELLCLLQCSDCHLNDKWIWFSLCSANMIYYSHESKHLLSSSLNQNDPWLQS